MLLFLAPPTGLEPVTSWLTVMRSTDWAMEENIAKHPKGWMQSVGVFLSSRAVASQVFSALLSLTSVFGMGTGGPSASSTPTINLYILSFLPFTHFGDSCGNRTRVVGVRGRSLNRLTNEPFVRSSQGALFFKPLEIPFMVHHQGLEPGTPWLRVRCSTNWANGAYCTFVLRKRPENWIKKK